MAPSLEPDRPSAGNRIATLDGLRGIAILLVLLCHFAEANSATSHWFNQFLWRLFLFGWVGVDLFFVLSGFLITGILCDARGSAGYFRNFYMRRVLRIFPLYYVSLIILAVLLPAVFASQPEMQRMQAEAIWHWPYLTNVRIAFAGWPAEPQYLGHFWSLAVEEQFYLFWPWLIVSLGPRSMIRWCGVMVLGAMALRVVLHSLGEATAAYVLMPTKLDSLAIGGLIALLAREDGGLQRFAGWIRGVGLACATVVVGIYAWYGGPLSGETLPMGTAGYTALAGLFASVIVAALLAPPSSPLARLWSSRPLVFFGRYSYALYVIHPAVVYFWPVALSASVLHVFTGKWILAFAISSGLMLVVCVGVALISWHVLEKHFLRLRFRFTDQRAVPALPSKEATG